MNPVVCGRTLGLENGNDDTSAPSPLWVALLLRWSAARVRLGAQYEGPDFRRLPGHVGERSAGMWGCEPREEAVFNVLAQTKLSSDNLRSRVMGCFKLDGTLNASMLKKLSGDAALSGCLSKVEDQYPEYRQTLAEP